MLCSPATLHRPHIRLAPDGDDEVISRRLADILQSVHHLGRAEEDSAGPSPLRLAIVVELHRALAHHHKLRVPVLVRWVRHVAGQHRRLMQFDRLARRQYAADHGAGFAVRRLHHGKIAEGKCPLCGEHRVARRSRRGWDGHIILGLRCGLPLAGGHGERCKAGKSNTQITTVHGIHAKNTTPPPRHIWHVLLGVSADGDHKVPISASAAKLERATHRSRRFMGFMLRILPPPHATFGTSYLASPPMATTKYRSRRALQSWKEQHTDHDGSWDSC